MVEGWWRNHIGFVGALGMIRRGMLSWVWCGWCYGGGVPRGSVGDECAVEVAGGVEECVVVVSWEGGGPFGWRARVVCRQGRCCGRSGGGGVGVFGWGR